MNNSEQKKFNGLKEDNENLKQALDKMKQDLALANETAQKYAPIVDVEEELATKQAQLDEMLSAIESVEQANKIIEQRDSVLAAATARKQALESEAEELEKTVKEFEHKYGVYEQVEEALTAAETKAGEITAQAEKDVEELLRVAKEERDSILSQAAQEAKHIKDAAQEEHDLQVAEGQKVKAEALAEAEEISKQLKARRAETEKFVKEQSVQIEVERKRILDEARSFADTITEEAKNEVATYYAGKASEGEARKKAIVDKANSERDNILQCAKENAELTAQSIRESANKYDEMTRSQADKYAADVREQADKLKQEAAEKLAEEKKNIMASRDAELAKAYADAEKIRQDARQNMEEERAKLEEAKRQAELDKDQVAQLFARAARREESLDEREDMLDEEVEKLVQERYDSITQELEQAKTAYRDMKQRAEQLGNALQKNRSYENHKDQFDIFMDKLKENGLTFSEDVCSKLFDSLKSYKTLQKNYDSLLKTNSDLRNRCGELEEAQSLSNNQDAMLKREKEKSAYFESMAKSLLEELQKNNVVSRDNMLSPVRQAPSFLDSNLSTYDKTNEIEWLESIRAKAEKNGLYFTKRQLYAYHTAQKIRGMSPVVVLAGISGTGKSELPRNYALYGGMHFLSIPVKPDWDSPAQLFGYYNSIEKRFEATELLRAMWQMKHDPSFSKHMFMVLLDEMNLAHPEQYFADILSKLETSRGNGDAEYDILLGGGEKPEKIAIGSNILWTGTMNEDETTKGLSDKVIDRSTLITFPRPKTLRSREVSDSEKQKMDFILPKDTWDNWLKQKRAESDEYKEVIKKYRTTVESINDVMSIMGRNLGHRVWQGIEEYIRNYPYVVYAKDDAKLKTAMKTAFTDAIAFKIMPKLRGLEVGGRNSENFDNIGKLLRENAPELESDFNKARSMTTELFQWSSAEFMNDEQGNK